LHILGDLYILNQDWFKAKECLLISLELYKKFGIGENDPDLITTLKTIDKIESKMKKKKGSPIKQRKQQRPKQELSTSSHTPELTRKNQSSSTSKRNVLPLDEKDPCFDVDDSFDDILVNMNSGMDKDDHVSQITFMTKSQYSPGQPTNIKKMIPVAVEEGTYTDKFNISSAFGSFKDFFTGFNMSSSSQEGQMHIIDVKESDMSYRLDDDNTIINSILEDYGSAELFHKQANNEIENIDESNNDDESTLFGASYVNSVQTQSLNDVVNKSASKDDESTLFGASFVNSVQAHCQKDSINTIKTSTSKDQESTLFGTSFINSVRTENQSSFRKTWRNLESKDDVSSLFGTSFVTSVESQNQTDLKKGINNNETLLKPTDEIKSRIAHENIVLNNKISDGPAMLFKDVVQVKIQSQIDCRETNNINMQTSLEPNDEIDELLAHMNVVSNDEEDDGLAKPFKDILEIETNGYEMPSPEYSVNQRKTLEKLSNCLDKLEEEEDRYGSNHIKTLKTVASLANLYFQKGDKDKGINMLCKTLAIEKKKHGRNSIEVAGRHSKIGSICLSMGKYEKAIESYLQAKYIEEFLYSKTDPRIAAILNQLGLAELGRGDFDMAMDYLQEALRIQRIYLAPNEINPDVSQTLVNIGSVYYKERNTFNNGRTSKDNYKSFIESGMLGKIAFAHSERGEYTMSTNFYEELLQLLKSRGESCSQHGIAAIFNCLGTLSVKLGRYVEAMSYHEQALQIHMTTIDVNEIDVCETNCNAGVVEYKSGNFEKGIEVFENAKLLLTNLLGADHPRLAQCFFHLGVIKSILFQHEAAMSEFKKALEIQMNKLHQHHPNTMNTQLEIGKVLLESDDLDLALETFEVLLDNQLEILGQQHPDVALTLYYIGSCYARMAKTVEAGKKFEKSLCMLRKLNVEIPEVAYILDQIGLIHVRKRKFDKGLSILQDSLRIRVDCLGEEHFETSYTLFNLGILMTEKRDFPQALMCFKDAMRIAIPILSMQHPFIGDIHLRVGHIHQRKCHFDEAKNEISRALKIYKSSKIPDSHSKVISAKRDIARVEHEESLCV